MFVYFRTIVLIALFSQYLSKVDIPVPGYKKERGGLYVGRFPLFRLFPVSIDTHSVTSYFPFRLNHLHSEAPTAEGRYAEPHTYRSHAFLSSWSSRSAAWLVSVSVRPYDDDAQHDGHTGQSMHAPSMPEIWYWISILWSTASCHTADRYHMTISRAQV